MTVTAIDRMGWLTGGTDGMVGFPAVRWLPGTAELTDERAIYGYTLTVAAVCVALTLLVLRSPAGKLLTGSRAAEARMRASGTRWAATSSPPTSVPGPSPGSAAR
ncbi:hypothetical protein NKH77_48040 [Streptomyces sp. M19]